MVYTSGAVSIEHEGVARVFYSKQKPRVCTINHKPRHGTTVLYNAIARRALFGHGLGTDCARGYQIAARRYCICCVKGRGRFSWGRRSHSFRCELFSLIVANCVEAIADAEQQLNKTVVSSRLLLGVERLLFSLRCWVPCGDSVAATPPGKIALLTLSLKRSDGH